jgi:hypothetical protein
MKQLTILCSSDLSAVVQDALVSAGVEGFLLVPDAVGVKPSAAVEHGRWPRWQSAMFVSPADDDAAAAVVQALRRYAGRCEDEPCLRILVSSLDAVY